MARPRGFDPGFSPGFGVGRYWYVLGPWVWRTATDPESGGVTGWWSPPPLTVGSADLRTLSQQAQAGGTPQGVGFFCTATNPGTAYTVIAQSFHLAEEPVAVVMRDAWQARTGYRPAAGSVVLDLLWDQLTTGADPAGASACKPLLPTTAGSLELFLGGHSRVRAESFRLGEHPHSGKVLEVLRQDFRRCFEDVQAGRLRPGQHQRVLDSWCERYGTEDWRQFVPVDLRAHVPGRLPHQTTIADNFDRANANPMSNAAAGWAWVEIDGDWQVFSNSAGHSANQFGTQRLVRADSALSSADHYAQVAVVGLSDLTTRTAGATARMTGVAKTGYVFRADGPGDSYLDKWVTGTKTQLQSGTFTKALPNTARCEANGSSLTGKVDGVSNLTATDTSITGNLYAGMMASHTMSSATAMVDDFEAADLAAGPAFQPAWAIGANSWIGTGVA